MKKTILLLVTIGIGLQSIAQKVTWVSTTKTDHWAVSNLKTVAGESNAVDVEILPAGTKQTINGFGGCFNELGYTSLQLLSVKDRQAIMKELFAPGVGANFTICRMPVGANDFSLNWYSYDETEGDFELKDFSIAHDMHTLVPFIKDAQKFNPALKLWASPWSPPQWMKKNKHYAAAMIPTKEMIKKYEERGIKLTGMDFSNAENGLKPDQVGKEGTDMFIQDDQYFKTYAKYFGKFVDAYKQQGVKIGMVMPQNEFNSAQVFPSCTWTAHGLAKFVSYLGPQMEQRGVNVFFGTVERANEKLTDTLLTSPESAKYIKGVGFQWAGKGAIAGIHQRYPNLALYQSEQECGDGQNDWKYCRYTWDLMKHYFNSGANAYMYWNIALKEGGISHWGWRQNSLVSVDTTGRTYKFNYEYYLLKHLSHYVKPGAKLLTASGTFNNLLAFKNPDNSVVIVIQNDGDADKMVNIKLGNKTISPLLKADSFNTFLLAGSK
ncbi:glycoside hydrolase family 30 beta sandwich domain-containing protein [Mucilaginibacter sp. KACC 22773]|uniref:glycoside hydrolase family 30 protein n=1 Tax=Mucilaginibacter sp. KACC 22773 TaxID=3025671 RepID=UPI0023663790|nr:glycoside hydrolase family 30 beta sandwich domain-containing protein [Mucilaginibacter sp. KACC 22773]WDF79851.1 glycoside hydrolase family 30 beta sandwich domain-containing protein [Mucilaginibacter sp. KACC 22773]